MTGSVSDLVVLGLLTEGPRHGYEINRELVRCDVKDWAGISRAQVYYSIRTLLEKGWVAPVGRASAGAGPMITAAQRMVELTIRQFETELAWLDGVESRLAGL